MDQANVHLVKGANTMHDDDFANIVTHKIELQIQPEALGPNIKEWIQRQLELQDKNKWDIARGFVSDVRLLQICPTGSISARYGCASMNVTYAATEHLPKVDQVVSATLIMIHGLGVMFQCGPHFKMFVSKSTLGDDFKLREKHITHSTSRRKIALQQSCKVQVLQLMWQEQEQNYLLLGRIDTSQF